MASRTRTAVVALQGGVGYELAGTEEWAPEAVAVQWDGAGASGPFVVAVSFYNDGGALIDRAFPEGVTNAVGDTGRTFFRPFRRGSPAGAGATGIQFDQDNQGDWLAVTATNVNTATGSGILIYNQLDGIFTLKGDATAGIKIWDAAADETTARGIEIVSDESGISLSGKDGVSINGGAGVVSPGIRFFSGAGDQTFTLGSGRTLFVNDDAGNPIFEIRDDGTIHGRAAVGAMTWDL